MGADAHGDKSLAGVCELNRNVSRADLKESTVRILHRESGSSFRAFGAATEKECCPKSEMDVSMTLRLELQKAAMTPQWTRGDRDLTSMMAQSH